MAERITLLEEKRIVLGVTGSIAAYKAADLASKLVQAGAYVDVIMTEAAQRFVSALTFQAVTGRPVYTDMWRTGMDGSLPTHIAHIGLAEGAHLLVIAPATAHHMAKLAAGMADDLLCVTALGVRCPIIIAPAMDGDMYEHPATAENMRRLKDMGAILVEPEIGRMASGMVGRGRLPEVLSLLGTIRQVLGREWGPLTERHIVVTAGGTREALDPVRFVSNRSSGKQGYAVAQAAVDAGASVTLITTTTGLPIPAGVRPVYVESAQEMHEAVLEALEEADALIMAAAVADFRPAEIAEQKIKKTAKTLSVELVRTTDILASVGKRRAETGMPHVIVGFAAETQDLVRNARFKLEKKGVDFIIANDITAEGAGFGGDTNVVTILSADGSVVSLPQQTKIAVAEAIIQRIAARLMTVPRRGE
ncbi:MAG: bifunctional phosphopantothenoylcysteine decarboxylase/phosphopantothenate--cysteine ligase CoaBC [Anaerolineae bacterium]|nr:bifunctional phosphopantothenoylcysteine decarboxylase/phosphopantothenate--cysteine ligase CoaBC [Anaerolineae bacterium]